MDIMKRINLLLDTQFINEEEHADLLTILEVFANRPGYEITEKTGGIMITHMAAAFRRNRVNESINPLSVDILCEIAASGHFEKASVILEEIKLKINNNICKDEEGYFLLHICTFIEKNSKPQGERREKNI